MYDAAPGPLQRARGLAAVTLAPRGLVRLRQEGCAKAMLPRTHAPDPEIVFLNTSGGLTGGDRLEFRLTLQPGARATATTQAAERGYDAAGEAAQVRVEAEVGAGGRLDWLPQETILFDGVALDRETRIALGRNAVCLTVETLVFGRAAMGERLSRLALRDRRTISRDGAPVSIEPLVLTAGDLAPRAALTRGARAVASVAFVAPGAEDAAASLHALMREEGVEAGVSGWDGRLMLRAFAADALPLRRMLIRVLARLRGAPPPRVWQP